MPDTFAVHRDLPVNAARVVAASLLAALIAACTSSRTGSAPTGPSAPPRSELSPSRTTAPTPGPTPSRASSRASSTASSTAPAIPRLSARARSAGLIDIRTIVPDAIVDLRYATDHNFVGVRLYPIGARCLVHRSMAAGLTTAARVLRHQGLVLVFWDCYRPHAVQVHMFRIVPDPNWVARPGRYATSHEAARSVDVTLARSAPSRECPAARRVQQHCTLDMGTGFDDFTARAHAFATAGVSAVAQANRGRLRAAMNRGGIAVYAGEWWHFDGPGALVPRPQLDAPLD